MNNQNTEYRTIKRIIDNENVPVFSCSDLPSEIPSRFEIKVQSTSFQCLFDDNINSDSLMVIFSGARTAKDKIPMFKRQSYYPFIPMKVLSIADPMFDIFPDLTLGWYYGTKNCPFYKLISNIVNAFCNKLNIQEKNLFFFGSSGGGYISLQMSNLYKSSTHIALNPQINISEYPYAKVFQKITNIDLKSIDSYRRNETMSIVKETSANIVLIYNYNDRHDCEKHLFPLCDRFGIDKLSLGLNKLSKNKYLWGYNIIGGHNTQGDQLIFTHIVNLAIKVSSGDYEITRSDDVLYKNISCLWRAVEWYIYSLKKFPIRLIN